jgi:hypothetical protein
LLYETTRAPTVLAVIFHFESALIARTILVAARSIEDTMRLYGKLALLLTALTALVGCRRARYTPPETPMPPNTILLSQMMQQLSAQPGFTEAMLKQLDGAGKKGPALMTPKLIDELRKRILGKDWAALDRFPGWSMREINPTVRVAGHIAGKDEKLEEDAAVHPGTPPALAQLSQFLDLGAYALNQAQTVPLSDPSNLPGFTTEGIVSQLGDGVTRGDGPNQLAPEHADSQRLADMLNRLAANQLKGTEPFQASLRQDQIAATPEQLIAFLQQNGHTVTVQDARYFANFGHFHYKGQDVMMPFWLSTKQKIPNAHGRELLIPASHAELEWHIHPTAGPHSAAGPLVNADISYYFGIDGKAEWRTMDTLDQLWVLKRNANTYTGQQAVEATRLVGLLTTAYMHAHAVHPKLPFGGYYALGVCQDGVSVVEQALTGRVTLYPNTVDATLFNDPRDHEINNLLLLIPKDRDGHPPAPERIFGSLPTGPGPGNDFAAITIPGLAPDLASTYAAWQNGTLDKAHGWCFYMLVSFGVLLLVGSSVILGEARRRKALARS